MRERGREGHRHSGECEDTCTGCEGAHGSRFTIRSSTFTIRSSRFTIHG